LCKACNSHIGTAFEADAERFFSAAPPEVKISLRTIRNLRVRLNAEDNPFVGTNPISMTVPGRGNEPLLELLKGDIQPHATINISLQGPAPDRVRLAVLSWAFLAAFAQYGYAFALETAVRVVRSMLFGQSADPLPSIAFSRPGTPALQAGTPSLVVAVVEDPVQVRLIGLGIDFGRMVGVLPIASDGEGLVYRDLEHLLLLDTPWRVVTEPIEEIVKGGSAGSFEQGLAVKSGPYLIVGVDRRDAEDELANGSLLPGRKRARPSHVVEAALDPPAELPHLLSLNEWKAMSSSGHLGRRHLQDLRRVVVEGRGLDHPGDASDAAISTVIFRARARFPQDWRPEIRYRSHLITREDRELLWLWGVIAWPDGRRVDIGPFLSSAALIEAIESEVTRMGGGNGPPWLRGSV
jgi:hypothetical protein